MITSLEMKEEIVEEVDAIDSDMKTTREILRQQEEALLFAISDADNPDSAYNKAQGKYIATAINKLSDNRSMDSTTVGELNNVISSLCKEIIGLRYRDKTNNITTETSKHTITKQQEELDMLAASLAHTQREFQKKLELEKKVRMNAK